MKELNKYHEYPEYSDIFYKYNDLRDSFYSFELDYQYDKDEIYELIQELKDKKAQLLEDFSKEIDDFIEEIENIDWDVENIVKSEE